MDLADNLSLVFHGVNDLRLETRPVPTPNDDQVLLKVGCVAICGSDLCLVSNGRMGSYVPTQPIVIGHEISGTVLKIGKKVTNLKPGDRVALDPLPRCQKCSCCLAGRYNICTNPAIGEANGGNRAMARFYVYNSTLCHKLPTNISLEEGALLEPFSVALSACKRGMVGCGSVVLITGAGPVGILTLIAAKAYEATLVIVTDVFNWRLDKAKQLGADLTLHVALDEPEEVIVEKIISLLGGRPTVSFDCAGFQSTRAIVVKATVNGGIAVLVGSGGPIDNIPAHDVLFREVDVRGVYGTPNEYPTAIEMVSTGKVNLKPLVTHHYKLEDSLKAFHMLESSQEGALKVLIHPNLSEAL